MRAAILTQYNEPLVVEEITSPDVGPNEVRVHIDASGVCHSDLTIATGGVPMPPPVILGHEGAGTILEVGSDVSTVAVGDKVIASFIPACGLCWYCLRDQSNLCEKANEYMFATRGIRPDGSNVFGMTGLGTFADEMVAFESMVVKVDTDLPADQLALIGCGVTTGVGAALNTAHVEPGSTVAVIGCGGVGQAVIQGRAHRGRVAHLRHRPGGDEAQDRRAARRHRSGRPVGRQRDRAGAGGDGRSRCRLRLRGHRPARDNPAGVPYGAPRRNGLHRGHAAHGRAGHVPRVPAFSDEKRLLGCFYGSAQVKRDFPRFVSLIETGRLDVGSMVSRHIKLDEVNDAFRAMQAGEVIRSVIV